MTRIGHVLAQAAPQEKIPRKMLTFYELDLGLNHVTRKAYRRRPPSLGRSA